MTLSWTWNHSMDRISQKNHFSIIPWTLKHTSAPCEITHLTNGLFQAPWEFYTPADQYTLHKRNCIRSTWWSDKEGYRMQQKLLCYLILKWQKKRKPKKNNKLPRLSQWSSSNKLFVFLVIDTDWQRRVKISCPMTFGASGARHPRLNSQWYQSVIPFLSLKNKTKKRIKNRIKSVPRLLWTHNASNATQWQHNDIVRLWGFVNKISREIFNYSNGDL